jgi:hypothetical protein
MPAVSPPHPPIPVNATLVPQRARPPQPDAAGPHQRARLIFPGDPDTFPGPLREWWRCPPFQFTLLGDHERSPAVARTQPVSPDSRPLGRH